MSKQMEVAEILEACGHVFIGAPEMHCRDYIALDESGRSCLARDKAAARFCALGIVEAACDGDSALEQQCTDYLRITLDAKGHSMWISEFNNNRKRKPEVVGQLFLEAAELAKSAA